jgi:hypothetical protein
MAGDTNTTGIITAVGYSALTANTTGTANTALGSNALLLSSTGSNAISIGEDSTATQTTANNNIMIGAGADDLTSATAGNAIVIGSAKSTNGGNSGFYDFMNIGYRYIIIRPVTLTNAAAVTVMTFNMPTNTTSLLVAIKSSIWTTNAANTQRTLLMDNHIQVHRSGAGAFTNNVAVVGAVNSFADANTITAVLTVVVTGSSVAIRCTPTIVGGVAATSLIWRGAVMNMSVGTNNNIALVLP